MKIIFFLNNFKLHDMSKYIYNNFHTLLIRNMVWFRRKLGNPLSKPKKIITDSITVPWGNDEKEPKIVNENKR